MSEIYHIRCANDDEARAKLEEARDAISSYEEMYVAPSFHPQVPAVVVIILPDEGPTLPGDLGAEYMGSWDGETFTPSASLKAQAVFETEEEIEVRDDGESSEAAGS